MLSVSAGATMIFLLLFVQNTGIVGSSTPVNTHIQFLRLDIRNSKAIPVQHLGCELLRVCRKSNCAHATNLAFEWISHEFAGFQVPYPHCRVSCSAHHQFTVHRDINAGDYPWVALKNFLQSQSQPHRLSAPQFGGSRHRTSVPHRPPPSHHQ